MAMKLLISMNSLVDEMKLLFFERIRFVQRTTHCRKIIKNDIKIGNPGSSEKLGVPIKN